MDEFDTQMELDDQKIQEFRSILQEIKRAVHEKYLYRSQNTNELKNVEKELVKFFKLLYPIVYNNKGLNVIPEELLYLRNKFYDVLQKYPRSTYYSNRIKYYLVNDLIDYPFDNTPDSKIVPNTTDLTKI
jgi:hypothetical protein